MKYLKGLFFYSCFAVLVLLYSCNSEDFRPDISNGGSSGVYPDDGWDIPKNEVYDGGPGKDGIPALTNPDRIKGSEAEFLRDSDLILGYKNGDVVIAYPHRILDWHEIINDQADKHAFAITYCPLTGTGIGIDRKINGEVTTFGVSGLLYNNNLIPYDRKTDSNWSQMLMSCVNGELRGKDANAFPLLETTWKTWKSMYPETWVVTPGMDQIRNYNDFPYGDYRTNHDAIFFPYHPKNTKFDNKERVHGVVIGGEAKAFPFKYFNDTVSLIHSEFTGVPLVVVGSQIHNFIVSFERQLPDGTRLDFMIAEEQLGGSPSHILLTDQEGNRWDIFGEAIEGPRKGQRLRATTSFMGYWFAWGAFYPSVGVSKDF